MRVGLGVRLQGSQSFSHCVAELDLFLMMKLNGTLYVSVPQPYLVASSLIIKK